MHLSLPECQCRADSDRYDQRSCPRYIALQKLKNDIKELGLLEIGSGYTREVYQHPYMRWVIKIPKGCQFMLANLVEWAEIQRGLWPSPCAHLEYLHGIPIVHMEHVYVPSYVELCDWVRKNPWINDTYDGPQVGRTSTGRIVRYDFGHDHGWEAFNVEDKWKKVADE